MKHRLIILFLALVLILPAALGSCGGNEADITTASDDTQSPPEESAGHVIVSGGVGEYTIARMDDAHEQILQKLAEVRDVIAEVTGVTLAYEDAFVKYGDEIPAAKQIVIGHSDVLPDRDILSGVGMLGYVVKTSGSRIGASGWSDENICFAADELIKLIREYGKEGELIIPEQNAVFTREVTTPDYPAPEREFVLSYYWGPSPADCTDENVKLVADAGFTRMQINVDDGKSVEEIRAAVKMAEKYGMDVSLYFQGTVHHFITLAEEGEDVREDVTEWVEGAIAEYGDLENISEWYLIDEPSIDGLKVVAMFVEDFRRLDPSRNLMINLLPGNITNVDVSESHGGVGYRGYLDTLVNDVGPDIISFDRYNFSDVGGVPNFGIHSWYFDNMWYVAETAKRASLPSSFIVQTSAFMEGWAELDEEQLRWEANMNLAYGFTSTVYFTYHWCGNGGFVDPDGVPTEQYYSLQNFSSDFVATGRQLAPHYIDMVFHLKTGELYGAPEYIPYGSLGEVEGKNAVIGFYDDGSFYIVNYEWATGAAANVLNLNDTDGALEWFDPSDSTWKAAEECGKIEKTADGYTLTFLSGEAVLLRTAQ